MNKHVDLEETQAKCIANDRLACFLYCIESLQSTETLRRSRASMENIRWCSFKQLVSKYMHFQKSCAKCGRKHTHLLFKDWFTPCNYTFCGVSRTQHNDDSFADESLDVTGLDTSHVPSALNQHIYMAPDPRPHPSPHRSSPI